MNREELYNITIPSLPDQPLNPAAHDKHEFRPHADAACYPRSALPQGLNPLLVPQDMRMDAEHIRMADQFVEVPGGRNNNNYANVRLIVQVAERAGVDAVWPGWWASVACPVV